YDGTSISSSRRSQVDFHPPAPRGRHLCQLPFFHPAVAVPRRGIARGGGRGRVFGPEHPEGGQCLDTLEGCADGGASRGLAEPAGAQPDHPGGGRRHPGDGVDTVGARHPLWLANLNDHWLGSCKCPCVGMSCTLTRDTRKRSPRPSGTVLPWRAWRIVLARSWCPPRKWSK